MHEKPNEKGVIVKDLPSLSPGETRGYRIAFQVTKPGQLDVNVEAKARNAALATAQACMTATGAAAAPSPGAPTTPQPIPLSVTMSGPPKPPTVGDTVKFTIDMKNTGKTCAAEREVSIAGIPRLNPTRATEGCRSESGGLAWNIDESARRPDGSLRDSMRRAKRRQTKPPIASVVTLPDGSHTESEASLEILKAEKPTAPDRRPPQRRPAEGLEISAAGLSNPVHPGNQLTYEIRVTNKGTVPVSTDRRHGNRAAGHDARRAGHRRGEDRRPEDSIRRSTRNAPGQTLTYRARVLAKQPGKYHLHVELATPALPKPMAVDSDETEVSN